MKYNVKYIAKKLFLSPLESHIRYTKIIRSRIQYRCCNLLKGYASVPPNIYIFVTNRCNYKCIMCDFSRESNGYFRDSEGKEISLEYWKKFIDSISLYRPAVFFPAPEPFLYKDIIPLVSYIKSYKLFCSLATNGSLLKKYAKELVDIGIDTLELSCDGPPEIHDKIRGIPGAFSNLISSIKELQGIKGKNKKPHLTITFTITHLNYLKIDETVDILDKLGVEMYLTISHLSYIPGDMAQAHNKKSDSIKVHSHTSNYKEICSSININELSKQIILVKKRKPSNIKNLLVSPELDFNNLDAWYNMPKNLNITSRCFFPWLTAHINFNGNVILSPLCGPIFGNIIQQDFISIWNSPKLREIRMKLFKDIKYEPCFGCCSTRTL